MGVHSIICVPIVYEKESLGILTVDNIESKRSLTKSDMNLLLGVASQTAVSIINAMSFQKLQINEKKYRDLVENANSIILRMDTGGKITFCNEFAQKFFGYSEDEILGQNVKGSILPDTESTRRGLENLAMSLKQNPYRQAVSENENVLRNGEPVWIAWTYKPIFTVKGRFAEILCIGNDITKLKHAAEEKKDLETQLQRAQKMEAIGTLAGGISHDFNNILQVISGYTQILLMSKEQSDPEYEMLDTIENSVQMASDLTKRLLIFSRKVESELKPVDLNQEVVKVTKMLERTIPKMITIELHLAGSLKTVNADTGQIEQILMNLGLNARDAMPDAGKLIFKTENVSLDEEYCNKHLDSRAGEYVMLGVSDNGHGMGSEVMEHIFEPFFTTKETGKGSGLGLAMVYGIVKSHGGHITCDSEPGQGTTFKIYFPIIKSAAAELISREAEAPIKRGSETILLVDDDEKIRDLGKEMLTRFGYSVLSACDGESALEFYKEGYDRVDLILLDLNMPGMGGARCLEKLIGINPSAKVVIASGYTLDGLTKAVIEKGAKGFVGKPYNLRHMLDVIREILDKD